MINTQIVNAKVEIINIINGLELPIVVSQMLINEVKQAIDYKANEVLKQEQEELLNGDKDTGCKEDK